MASQDARIQRQPLFWEIVLANKGHESTLHLLKKGIYGLYYSHAAPFSINTQKYMALCYEKRASESFKEILF